MKNHFHSETIPVTPLLWDDLAPRVRILATRLGVDTGGAEVLKCRVGMHKPDEPETADLIKEGMRPLINEIRSSFAYLSSGGMTQLLDRLEQRGLVARRPHPTDRRGLLVQLTPDGRRLADDVLTLRLTKAAAFLAGLTAEQREQLQTLLRALLVSLTRDEKRNTSDTNALPS